MRKYWLVTAAVVVTIGVIVAVWFGLSVKPTTTASAPTSSVPSHSATSTIPSLAPADAATMIITPAGKTWWGSVVAAAPLSYGLAGLDAATQPIVHYGYTLSPDVVKRDIPLTGPLRLVYLETASVQDADKVGEWVRTARGFEGRRVTVHGTIVIISASWAPQVPAPVASMASNKAFTGGLRTDKAVMFYSPDAEATTLTSTQVGMKSKSLNEFFHTGVGFETGTAWTGTSTDGRIWRGNFSAGGIDVAQVDLMKTEADLKKTSKTLGTLKTNQTPKNGIQYSVVDPGDSAILNYSSIRLVGTDKALGSGQVAAEISAPDNAAVTYSTDYSQFFGAATGLEGSSE